MTTSSEEPLPNETCYFCTKPAVHVMVDRQEGERTVRQPECQEHAELDDDYLAVFGD